MQNKCIMFFPSEQPYLEADDVGGDEHAHALHQVAQGVDEGSPDRQAAVGFGLGPGPRGLAGRGGHRAVGVAVAVEVPVLVQ